MNRRLYFLFPDVSHALATVNELEHNGVDGDHIHALARKGTPLHQLPESGERLQQDLSAKVEKWAWNGNLVLFSLAGVALIGLLFTGHTLLAILPAAIMAACFYGGYRFTRLPNTHLNEFREALAHGEVLLMVDVPVNQVARVEERVHQHHPEATPGGTSWEWDRLAA